MNASRLRELPFWLLFFICGTVSNIALAGSDQESALDFTRSFLEKYPRFRAEGTMISSPAGSAPYRCKVEVTFDKADSMRFSYNTDGVKNIVPYDLIYTNPTLREIIFNRDRSEELKNEPVKAPMRMVFNFVWDVLRESESGVGLKSIVFTGLMKVEREDKEKHTILNLKRRFPAMPVQLIQFTFDDDQRLKRIDIIQSEKDKHRIDIRRFRPIPTLKPPPKENH